MSSVGDKRRRIAYEEGARRLIENEEPMRSAPSLTDEQLDEIVVLARQIEEHFGFPQDIEWCFDGRQIRILQSRPIPATGSGRIDTEWTRANTREVLPDLPAPEL